MSRCLISFSSQGREDYNKALLRLIDSAREHFLGDMHMMSPDHPQAQHRGIRIHPGYPISEEYGDCQTHKEAPYQFKPFLFKQAFEQGYDEIIWCDSTIRMVKSPRPLFERAKKEGVVVFNNLGHPLRKYIHDKALTNVGITEEELKDIEQIMACVLIFNLRNEKGKAIFDEWIRLSMDKESFQEGTSGREEFVAHRHDQAILSGLCWKHGITHLPYGTLVYPPHDRSGEHGNDFYFVNKL